MEDGVLILLSCALTLVATLVAIFLKGIKDDLKVMSVSVNMLNEKIGVVINDIEWHKDKIENLELRLEKLETKLLETQTKD